MVLIPKDSHFGQRCFIIGSGPSLKGMDLSWLRHEITIGVNQSYKALPFDPTYIAIGDSTLWPFIKSAFAKMKKTKIVCSGGTKGTVGTDYSGDNLVVRVPMIRPSVSEVGFLYDLLKGVRMAWNVVPEIALPFVCWAGFAEVYLIGCDCSNTGYAYENPVRGEGHQYIDERAMKAYNTISRTPDLPTKIFNATVGGKLEAFPRRDFESLKPPLVIGFYTPNADYQKMAERMKAGVEAQGLECEIRERPSAATPDMKPPMPWVINCAQCGPFIRDMRKEYPNRDFFYLDADAVMIRYPILFQRYPRNYDFAVTFITVGLAVRQLSSNALYFGATDKASALLDRWCAEQEKRNMLMSKGHFCPSYKWVWDQRVLQEVFLLVPGLRWIELPWAYAKITVTPRGDELMPSVDPNEIVVKQFQASRWNKHTLVEERK